MKAQKIISYQDTVSVKTKVSEYMKRMEFNEFCVAYFKKHPIPSPGKYRDKLLSCLELVKPGVYQLSELAVFLENCPHLTEDKQLGIAFSGKMLELLGVQRVNDSEQEIDAKCFLKGYLFTRYYIAKSLETVMSKYDAIAYFKKMSDAHTTLLKLPWAENVSELAFFKAEGHFYNAFNEIRFIIDEGRSGCRIDKCRWAETLKALNDPDYAYVVACHYDFEAAKRVNPAFTLTRLSTLMQGNSYCDFVWHDNRVHSSIAHPDTKFWLNLRQSDD